MKLRIQGRSLRLRLNQAEVAVLRDGGCAEAAIDFAPGSSLSYALTSSPLAESPTVAFNGCAIRVTVPAGQLAEWADGDQVGIEAQSPGGVELLIEKDFQCLHRSVEEEPEAFPHPLRS